MKVLDYIVSAVFLIALVAIAFFWGCDLDPLFTAIAGVMLVAASLTMIIQNKKIKKLV